MKDGNERKQQIESAVEVVTPEVVEAWNAEGLIDVRPLWRSLDADCRFPDAMTASELKLRDDLVAAKLKELSINSPWRPKRSAGRR